MSELNNGISVFATRLREHLLSQGEGPSLQLAVPEDIFPRIARELLLADLPPGEAPSAFLTFRPVVGTVGSRRVTLAPTCAPRSS